MTATENVRWLVDDMLTVGGLSIVAAKPKVGKSTLARCLALAVARGGPWLGRNVAQGDVIYIALEEQRAVVRDHFRAMGVSDTPTEPIQLFIGSPAPKGAMQSLAHTIEDRRPALIIIDPIFRLLNMTDINDYAEVNHKFEPLINMVRDSDTHILGTHHARKDGGARGDETLGSTAILGSIDTLLTMKNNGVTRTLSTVQRHGPEMSPTVLVLDPTSLRISAGGTTAALAHAEIEEEVCAFLADADQPQTMKQIEDALKHKRARSIKAVKALVSEGRLSETGEGKKGSPKRYEIANTQSHTLFPTIGEGNTEQNT